MTTLNKISDAGQRIKKIEVELGKVMDRAIDASGVAREKLAETINKLKIERDITRAEMEILQKRANAERMEANRQALAAKEKELAEKRAEVNQLIEARQNAQKEWDKFKDYTYCKPLTREMIETEVKIRGEIEINNRIQALAYQEALSLIQEVAAMGGKVS